MKLARHSVLLLALISLLLAVACGGAAEEAPADPPAEEPAATAESTAPRIFFYDLEDGDTVPTILALDFGAENFVIEPVGDGMVHEGAGHFHVGLNTECLPGGVVIPTADPWVHFGDGSSNFEISLEEGEHTLVLQIGDGEHRTSDDPGLCHVVTVNASADA